MSRLRATAADAAHAGVTLDPGPQRERPLDRRLILQRMILEHALLPVKPGREEQFEGAFAEAKAIIASMPGFIGLSLHRGLERPSTYLLLVRWRRVEDHTHGFRESPEYQEWRGLLHDFYEPFPNVDHYEPVHTA